MLRTATTLLSGVVLLAVLSTPSALGQATPLASGSTWVNQLGSVMTIQSVSPSGLLTGTYVTKVGCGAEKTRALTGWYNKGAVTFTVNWEECASLTAWAGQIEPSLPPRIASLWHLVLSGQPKWDGTLAGTDTFTLK